MSHDRSAAIWFDSDGFDPQSKGLNGRRMAGNSFLRGLLKHAVMDEIVALSLAPSGGRFVKDLAKKVGCATPVRTGLVHDMKQSKGLNAIHFPGPSLMDEVWRRHRVGQRAWSLTGITHTTATKAVMTQMLELRTVPTAPWDAIICTSQAVQNQVRFQLDEVDRYLKDRFGGNRPARFQTPIIPLGIECAEFAPDERLRATMRQQLGISPLDVVFLTVGRLTPHEKFDPLPVFMAMQHAAKAANRQLHYVLCGFFPDDISRDVFRNGAAALMPNVKLHVLNGKDPGVREAALSGSDAFVFAIDNIQETFGLAPVEAMAAGLPIVASDWDGMKDSVMPDVGFRVTTRMAGPGTTKAQAIRYQAGTDNFARYAFQVASLTQVDVPELAARLLDLAQNPDLRKRMGQAGQARAKSTYDWSVIIPQMQDLWAELAKIRNQAGKDRKGTPPTAPAPTRLFEGYTTPDAKSQDTLYAVQLGASQQRLNKILDLREVKKMDRWVVREDLLLRLLDQYALSPDGASIATMAQAIQMPVRVVDRGTMVLLKYDLLRVLP